MLRGHRFVPAGPGFAAAVLSAVMITAGSVTPGIVSAGHFQDSLTEALAKSGGKPVLVDFYTDW